MTRSTRFLVALLVLAMAPAAFGQVTDEDVDRARAEVNRIVAESQELGDEVQEAWARQFELDHEIATLNSSIEFARLQLTDAEQRLEEVAVELYMGSTSVASLAVLFNASDDEYEAGFEYLREVTGVDDDVVSQLRVFRRELDRQTARLDEASAEQLIVTAELEERAFQLQQDLGSAQAVYDQVVEKQRQEEEERRRRAEEEARRRAEEAARQATSTTVTGVVGTTGTTAAGPTTTSVDNGGTTTTTTSPPPPPPPSGNGACPVAGAVSFSDTWGAPRSGGRAHEGVDMIAARGTPLAAIVGGRIKRISNSSLGGKSLWLRADNGDEFYYAHLDGYADISVGQNVAEGYIVGYTGSTGNAPSWLPHLHFEYHPGGGRAVNPYPLVKSICG